MAQSPPSNASLLISSEELRAKVAFMAEQIDLLACSQNLLLLGVLKGAVHFVSDLVRGMKQDVEVEWVRVSTYGDETSPSGESIIQVAGDFSIRNKHVLILDDILDRGNTCVSLFRHLERFEPASLSLAALLVKDGAIQRSGMDPILAGFHIPDKWVIGYGMDSRGRYRNLDAIYALD